MGKWGTANSPVHMTSILRVSLDQTFVSMADVYVIVASFILPASSGKVVGNYGT